MKLKYLGTGAAEGVPSMFCQCANCKKSRALGGRNLRTRSQALVNDELMIDFNADAYWHFVNYNIDCEKICGYIITHSHPDHLYPAEAEIAKPSLSNAHRRADFYSAKSGYDLLAPQVEQTSGQATATLVEAGKPFVIKGEHEYLITPMNANHNAASAPLIYSIECEGKRMLYAHDTGYFPDDTWAALEKLGRFDLVTLDCTHCNKQNINITSRHLSLNNVLVVLERMRKQGNVDDKTILIVNHFSHNGGNTYDDMAELTKPHGIITSYDGMEVEF